LWRQKRNHDELGGKSRALLAVPTGICVCALQGSAVGCNADAIPIPEVNDFHPWFGCEKLPGLAGYELDDS
jgi:hypothetical protein